MVCGWSLTNPNCPFTQNILPKIKTDNMKMAVSIVQYAPPLYTDIVCGTLRISHRAESHTLVNTQFGVTAWPKIHVLEQCESESARPLEEGWHPWWEKRYKHKCKKERKNIMWLLWQHESEIDATQELTFLLMSGATTNRHVQVIMFQNIKFWRCTS